MPGQYDRLIEGSRIHSLQAVSTLVQVPVAPSEFDRLVSGYPPTQTTLLGDPCCARAAPPSFSGRRLKREHLLWFWSV